MTEDCPRLAIPTPNPNHDGGVQSKTRLVYNIADSAGFDPYLVCTHVEGSLSSRFRSLMETERNQNLSWECIYGMETALVPEYFPNIPLSEYIFSSNLWQEALSEADLIFGVCGSVHCCYPLLEDNRKFGCYVATLLREERTAMRADGPRSNSLLKRTAMWFRDAVTLPVMDRIEREIYEAATTIVPVSEHTGSQIIEAHDIDPQKIKNIPYPIDTEKYSPKTDSIGGNPTIMFAGNLHVPRKNVQLLIRVLSVVQDDIPGIRLKLLGSDSYSNLESFARDLGVRDAIDFEGRVSFKELLSYYRRADVFAIPSQQEGLAIVGLEAMASGTPVVSTRCGGPEEYIVNGNNGYLVPLDEVTPFADRLIEILKDDELRKSLGENARKKVEAEYSQEVVEGQFIELFRDLALVDV